MVDIDLYRQVEVVGIAINNDNAIDMEWQEVSVVCIAYLLLLSASVYMLTV